MNFNLLNLFLGHHHGHSSGEADVGRHRSQTRRHHQVGDVHQRAARHVHGHGHVGRKSGKMKKYL